MGDRSRAAFEELVGHLSGRLRPDEVLAASFTGEDSVFIRVNGAAVRQAGSVHQGELTLELIRGRRHAAATVQLAVEPAVDRARCEAVVDDLRERLEMVPEDPFLLHATDQPSTERVSVGSLPDPEHALAAVRAAGAGRELVGMWASGTSTAGFANSSGQRNWFASASFCLDWSFHLHADRAIKDLYAGTHWDDDAFARKVARSAHQLEVLDRPAIDLAPGGYRTYLAPAALAELIGMLAWGGFGLKSTRTRQTPLLRMHTEGATFADGIRLVEATAAGTAPDFQEQGFARPDEVVLVDRGEPADLLVSPRSAQEFGVPTNGAAGDESPRSLAMAPGSIPAAGTAEALGTGLHVENLWYLNFSDRSACRTTGMTRFATFWVDGGEIVAPVNVLRFDDTAFHLLGDRLAGLTDEAEVLLDTSTYHRRSTSSVRLPGALVEEMRFTL
jgi:predicted Zn-dependent protease